MNILFRKKNSKKTTKLTDAARAQVGYRSQPNRVNVFGRAAHYDGAPWNGSFVDRMLEEAEMREVSTVSTVAALQHYINRGRLRETRPKVGDLVFYGFATNGLYPFEQPHIGIVSDVTRWNMEKIFRAIEGETATGSPKGSQEVDGVFERVRSKADVIGFVTPKHFLPPITDFEVADRPKLRPSYFTSNPATRQRATEVLQTALARATGRAAFNRGVYDEYTQGALDEFRRNRGMLGKTGKPDDVDLQVLNRMTGKSIFRTEKDD